MWKIGAHILVYPFPTSGHIIPLLDLTHRLLLRGLTITVLLTPSNLSLLDPLLSRHDHTASSLRHLVLPAPEPSTSHGHLRLLHIMRRLQELHYPALLQWFRSHPSPPVAILSDFFLGWTHSLASELGVPRVVFSPSGAFGYSINLAVWRDLPKKIDDPDDANYVVSFPCLPNCPKYPWYQISHVYRNSKEGDPDWELYKRNWLENSESWGVVFNSFAELEGLYLEHVKKEAGQDRVWTVGPVLPAGGDDEAELAQRGGSSSVECEKMMTWLDERREESVVYVCFGSRQVLAEKQTEELAAALEKSGVDFIWCVRYSKNSEESGIPEGFKERVGGRGFLIKGWAPQVAILRHRAVGAFLTHCGWNSTLEGIVAGVVMLAWPMSADQFANAQLLVDQLGVGIRVGESTQNIPESTQLARVVAESVDGRSPKRIQAKKLSEEALKAVNGGSSDKDMDAFVKTLKAL